MSDPPAAASTRCARPDCISLREELELVRGDLQELESENEQLHDKLALVEAAAQSAAQEHQLEQTASHAALTHKQEECTRLEHTVLELRTTLQQVQQELAATTAASRNLQDAHSSSPHSIAALEQQNTDLRNANAALEAAVAELRAAPRQLPFATTSTTTTSDKRSELSAALHENEQLRSATHTLEDALARTAAAASENEAAAAALLAHQQTLRDALDEQTIEITQLHAKLEQLENDNEALEAHVLELDERERDVDALLQTAAAHHAREQNVLRHERDALQQTLTTLEHERKQQALQQAAVSSTTTSAAAVPKPLLPPSAADDIAALEQQLAMLEELRVRDRATIAALEQRVTQQQSDLESLTEHLETFAATTEQATPPSSSSVVERLTQQLQDQRAVIQTLEQHQATLERSLVDARDWNAQYERGAGLEDVVAFQRQLRKQLEKQQHANVGLRNQLNQQLETNAHLHAAFSRLKRETGKPPEFTYDDLALAVDRTSALAEAQAFGVQLEQQLGELEAERVRLLQRLREQAKATGRNVMETLGVSHTQWHVIETFIARVRATRTTDDGAQQLLLEEAKGGREREPVQRPAAANESMENELAAARATIATLTNDKNRLRRELQEQQQLMTTAATTREQQLQLELAIAQNEMKAMQRRSNDRDALRLISAQVTQLVEAQAINQQQTQQSRDPQVAAPATVATDASLAPVAASDTSTNTTAQQPQQQLDEAPVAAAVPVVVQSSLSTQTSADRFVPLVSSPPQPSARPQQPQQPQQRQQQQRREEERTNDAMSIERIAAAVAIALENKLTHLQQPRALQSTPSQSTQPQPQLQPMPPPQQASPSVSQTTQPEREIPVTSAESFASTAAAVHPSSTSASSRQPPRIDALAFESEDALASQLDVVQHLHVCLDDLTAAEAQIAALTQDLQTHEAAFAAVSDQQTLLYQHLFHLHSDARRRDAQAQRALASSRDDVRTMQRKCERLDALLHALDASAVSQHAGDCVNIDSSDASLRSQLIALTRSVATFEARDAVQRRQLAQLHADVTAAEHHSRSMENDALEMERTLQHRIVYLESWKRGADAWIERMTLTLEQSVWKLFADRHVTAITQLLQEQSALSEAFATLHAQWLAVMDAPSLVTKLQHENALLEAEKRVRDAPMSSVHTSIEPALQRRINELEQELEAQTQRVRDVEQLHAAQLLGTNRSAPTDAKESDVVQANALLTERISEVEQLYASLARECERYKDIAALAARQANTLATRATQDDATRRVGATDTSDADRRASMAATDDHAVVGRLQQQLLQLQRSYQQFVLKYDLLVDDQQQQTIRATQLELELERRATLLADERERSHLQITVLETTLAQVSERDWSVRNATWDAFRKRLERLDDALVHEQARRRALEHEIEESRTVGQPLRGRHPPRSRTDDSTDKRRLQAQIDALETRERVLLSQLTNANASTAFIEQEAMLQAEVADLKTLNADLLQQLQQTQARVTELIRTSGTNETTRQELLHANENLAIELQHARSQLELVRSGSGSSSRRQQQQRGARRTNNKNDDDDSDSDADGSNQTQPIADHTHAPLLHKKVGMYEQDQAALQQAAQATIASLKLLVSEKNALLQQYEHKLTSVRLEFQQLKAAERTETTAVHKKLFDDNQRMIAQLQDAMATIQTLERTGTDKRALAAAAERHDDALNAWHATQKSLEATKQRVRELEVALEVVTNERDVAEARAGEALEEIVLTKDALAQQLLVVETLEAQLGTSKRSLALKATKMAQLRDALIQLKDEFLQAEDRHAIDVAKAEAAAATAAAQVAHVNRKKATTTRSARMETEKEEKEEWEGNDDEKQRLEQQVTLLQEKLALATRAAAAANKRLDASSASSDRSKRLRPVKTIRKRTDNRNNEDDSKGEDDDANDANATALLLRAEVARLERVIHDRVGSEARVVDRFEKQVRVLEAQNVALREATVPKATNAVDAAAVGGAGESGRRLSQPPVATTAASTTTNPSLKHWEAAKKLQRRNEVLTLKLQDAQSVVQTHASDVSQLREQLRVALEDVAQCKRLHHHQTPRGGHAASSSTIVALQAQVADVMRQNAFLHETLVLKRREWSDDMTQQAQTYERDVLRLRQRLSALGAVSIDPHDRLQHEEQQALVAMHVQDELVAMSTALRAKDDALIQKDTQLLALELEIESLRLEVKRLQRQPPQSDAGTSSRSSSGAQQQQRLSSVHQQTERQELEVVIANMKKVIERLRSENERLVKAAASTSTDLKQFQQLKRLVRDHRDARAQLERDNEDLRGTNTALRNDKLRLQHRLRVATSTAGAGTTIGNSERDSASSSAMRLQNMQLQLQRKNERLAQLETTCDALERTAERREAFIQELQTQLREQTTERRHSRRIEDEDASDSDNNDDNVHDLEHHVAALEDENARLQRELAAFDEDFFDEIEELKYQFATAVREKQRLEQRLQALGS